MVVLSDNRENAKRLAKGAICLYGFEFESSYLLPALPAKPITFIPLSDADSESSLSFVMQKLRDGGINTGISVQQTAYVERLGGRASDLESVSY